MSKIDPRVLETVFVPADTPTLGDCIREIEAARDLSPVRRRDLASGLRRVANGLGHPADDTPADPTWLQPRVARIAPAAIGISDKTWSNAVSNAHAALNHCGVVDRRFHKMSGLDASWSPLWDAVVASGDQSIAPALGRFVRFLNRLGIAPEDVDDTHTAAFAEALRINELRKSPENSQRQAIDGWNLAVRRIEGWPNQRLTPVAKGNRYALPLGSFPESFQADVTAYVSRLEAPDPLDPHSLTAALRPATVRHRRAQILRVASALVKAGTPAETISDLRMLVDPANAKRALRWMMARHEGRTTPGIADTAILLKNLSRHLTGVPEVQATEIADICRRLAVSPTKGLTVHNRERLRQFEDATVLRKLLTLPDALMKEARGVGPSHKAARLAEMAVAIAMLSVCPIRRKNICGVHLDRNLRRLRDGRVFLVFTPGEVKNRRDIEFELPARIVTLIDAHVATRSPYLCPKGCRWLFPRRDGAVPMDRSGFSGKVSQIILKRTGAEMNPHLFRHLAAKLWLDRHPGSYEALRRLLGHSELSSTINAYAGFEAGVATQLFADLIDNRRTAR